VIEHFYRDTQERLHNDSSFAQAVQHMALLAERHGFTPGELKQIAFAAAVYVEERSVKPLMLKLDERMRWEITRETGR